MSKDAYEDEKPSLAENLDMIAQGAKDVTCGCLALMLVLPIAALFALLLASVIGPIPTGLLVVGVLVFQFARLWGR